MPTWKLVLESAQLLSARSANFGMKELILEVQRFDPGRGRGSIAPVIQGMTVNAAKGPHSPCGKPLYRVEHGIYRLMQTAKLLEIRSQSGSVLRETFPPISRRTHKAQIVEQRVVGLIEDFAACVELYDEQAPFTRRGQYTMHRKTIDRRRTLLSVNEALLDEEFLDDLYDTLHAWGIGRRASKLDPRRNFGIQLGEFGSLISTFEEFHLEDKNLKLEEIASQLWDMCTLLGVVENVSLVVPSAKILHHLLPDLVPPMDRAWTGSFFMWSAQAPQTDQKETFVHTFVSLGRIARATQPSQYVGQGWRTCPAKIVDNAVIGYCKLHGLASKISDLKVIEATLGNLEAPSSSESKTLSPVAHGVASLSSIHSDSLSLEFKSRDSLERGHLDFQEGAQDVSYEYLFGPYLENSKNIKIIDPYVRNFYQAKNLMEFIEVVRKFNSDHPSVKVELLTIRDPDADKAAKQLSNLEQVKKASNSAGVHFEFRFAESHTIHDREVIVDLSWKIILGRGLDIYQFIADDPFNMAHKDQSLRKVKRFGVTYIRGKFEIEESDH